MNDSGWKFTSYWNVISNLTIPNKNGPVAVVVGAAPWPSYPTETRNPKGGGSILNSLNRE
jgi:hypothetical protein